MTQMLHVKQKDVCASAQARGAGAIRARGTSARWRRSYGCAVKVYDASAAAEIDFRRPLAAKRNPLLRGCRLGRATGVTPIEALWRDPSGGFVLSGHEMHMGGGRSCTKFKNWNRPPER